MMTNETDHAAGAHGTDPDPEAVTEGDPTHTRARKRGQGVQEVTEVVRGGPTQSQEAAPGPTTGTGQGQGLPVAREHQPLSGKRQLGQASRTTEAGVVAESWIKSGCWKTRNSCDSVTFYTEQIYRCAATFRNTV